MAAFSGMGGRISIWGGWRCSCRVEGTDPESCWILSPHGGTAPEPSPSLPVPALMHQHLPQALNPLAPEHPTGMPGPIDSSFLHVATASPPSWGEKGIKPNMGVSGCGNCRQAETGIGLRRAVRLRNKPVLLLGCVHRCVGDRKCMPSPLPPRARVGCFTFVLPNKLAQKSLPETVPLDHLNTASLHSPLLPPSPPWEGEQHPQRAW